ncbi:MAG: LytR/AlgR family response regulator transcription factor [Luteibaculaceae bacterium]
MSVRVVVIEDEAIVRKDITLCLARLGYQVVGTGDTADKAVELAMELKPDIFLMDIKIKGDKTGIDAALAIKKQINLPIIYLTAYADDATLEKAKQTEPYGYILKPFKEVDIKTAIEMAMHKHKKDKEKSEKFENMATMVDDGVKSTFLFIKHNGRLIKVDYDEVIFIEALKDYVNITLSNTRYTVHSTMTNIEQKLPAGVFCRVHRSYIANVQKINAIDSNTLYFSNSNKEVPIGASYKDLLLSKINQL